MRGTSPRWRWGGVFSLLLLHACVGRALQPTVFGPKNEADYKYVWRQRRMASAKDYRAGLVSLYQSRLGEVLSSACRNGPSDSAYFYLARSSGCSEPESLLAAVARLLKENDLASTAPSPPVLANGHLLWIDFPRSCRAPDAL